MSDVRHVAMPHQKVGAAFLAARGVAILADEPGAGKSFECVMACDMAGARRILVACPAAVRATWHREFVNNQAMDRRVTLCDGFARTTPGDGVTVVSHASFADGASVAAMRAGAPYDVVVVDEIHLIRQWDALRTRNIMEPDGAWSWGTHFWGLTGTPVVNSACDLWPFAYGPLRTPVAWWDWGLRFCEEMRNDGQGGIRPIGLKNASELAGFLRENVLRRTLDGIGIKLPPLETRDLAVPVAPDVLARVMADLEGWTPARLADALERKDELKDSAIARVRKVLGMAKADAVAAHVHDVVSRGGGPVVVFFQHTAVRERLYAMLSGRCGYQVSWIDGKVTPGQVDLAERWFQAGRLDVLLVQTDSGGVGLNLTRGSRVVVAELPWTAVGLWQAIKRIYRIGQNKPCIAEITRAKGCWLEDALAATINRKHLAAEKLLSLLETYT